MFLRYHKSHQQHADTTYCVDVEVVLRKESCDETCCRMELFVMSIGMFQKIQEAEVPQKAFNSTDLRTNSGE